MANTGLKAGIEESERTKCPHCGSALFWWESDDAQFWCAGCNSRFDGRLRLLKKGEASPFPEQPAQIIQEVKPESSPRVPATHLEADNAKTLTSGTIASKRQQEPAHPFYTYSADGASWWNPQEIVFIPKQVLWLLPLLPLLRSGGYPPNPKETGYIDEPITRRRKRAKKRGYFTIPVELASELDARLERVGQDGILLEFIYSAESEDKLSLKSHIAIALRTDINSIDRRCRRALSFVSGWKRKGFSYREYVGHRREKKGDDK